MGNSKSNNGFIKHFAVIGLGTAINMFLSLATTPIITRIVSKHEYGMFSIFQMYESIAVMVLCMGMDQTLVRYFYEEDRIEYKQSLLKKCIKLPCVFSIIVSIIFVLCIKFSLFDFDFGVKTSIALCIYVFTLLLYRFSLLLVRLSYKSKLYTLLNICNKAVYIVLVIPGLFFVQNGHFYVLVVSIK